MRFNQLRLRSLSSGVIAFVSLIAILSACGSKPKSIEDTTPSVEASAQQEDAAEPEPSEPSSDVEQEQKNKETASESAKDEKKEIPEALKGTWETASNGYEYYDTPQAAYYVRFDDGIISYGHMRDDEFLLEYYDIIQSIEKTEWGGCRIQAESSDGTQYTYQTSKEDPNVLDYFFTWDEDEFMDKYSGSSSLFRGYDNDSAGASDEDDDLFYKSVYERLLTTDDLAEIEKLEAGGFPDNRSIYQMMINEIYSRHGLIHHKENVQKFFEGKSWYKGRTESSEEVVEEFSQIEKDNVIVLRNKDKGNPDIYEGVESKVGDVSWEGFFGDKELMDELAIVKCNDGTYNVDYSVFRTGSFLGKPTKIEGNTMLVESDSYGAKVEYLIDFSDMENIKVTVTKDGWGMLGNHESTGMYRHADSYYDYLKSVGWTDYDIELTREDFFKGTAYER